MGLSVVQLKFKENSLKQLYNYGLKESKVSIKQETMILCLHLYHNQNFPMLGYFT